MDGLLVDRSGERWRQPFLPGIWPRPVAVRPHRRVGRAGAPWRRCSACRKWRAVASQEWCRRCLAEAPIR